MNSNVFPKLLSLCKAQTWPPIFLGFSHNENPKTAGAYAAKMQKLCKRMDKRRRVVNLVQWLHQIDSYLEPIKSYLPPLRPF